MQLHSLLLLLLVCLTCLGQPADPVPPPLSPRDTSIRCNDAGPGVEVDYQMGQVTRKDSVNRVLWTVKLDGAVGGVRDPHVVHDADRIYLSCGDGVTALDRKTGKVAWHARGPSDRLYLSGKRLLATQCDGSEDRVKDGRWFTARDVATGAELFNIGLPVRDFDPWPIREVAGLYLVQAGDGFNARGAAFLVEPAGKVWHRFDRQVTDGRKLSEDRVFLTTKDVVRVSGGKEVWTLPFDARDSLDAGGLLDVPGGDLLVFRYGGIHDSGVQVTRLDLMTGKKKWTARCAALGVGHSKYRHRATAVLDGAKVRVTSRADGGSFVETLDLDTGKQLDRRRNKPE